MYLGEAGRKAYMNQQDINKQLNQAQQITNCLPSTYTWPYTYVTPTRPQYAIGIDKAENGWVITIAGKEHVATSFEGLLGVIKAAFPEAGK